MAARRPALLDLPPAEAAERLLRTADEEWAARFTDELDRRMRPVPLQRVMRRWDLSAAHAARLFGVSRQALSKWLAAGPPAERAAAVADLAAATELLERYVRPERIPAVVRRPAAALGGASLLELAERGEHRAVADAVREMVDLRRVQP